MNKSPWTNKEFAEDSLKLLDEKFKPYTSNQVDYLVKKMNLVSGSNILDLGCGAGRHSIEFAKRGFSVTGIDISEFMLDNAKKRSNEEKVMVNYIQSSLANLSDLDLKEESFNGAICLCESGIGVLGGEDKELDFFNQVYKLLLQDSYFILTVFNSIRLYIKTKDKKSKFNYINSTILWAPPIEFGGEKLSEAQRVYTPSEIQMLLRLCGFSEIQILSCKDIEYSNNKMNIDDVEMLVIAKK